MKAKDMKIINLDDITDCKDEDIELRFGGARFIIQYRVDNALRPGHPFIDILTPVGEPAFTVDLVDEEGCPIRKGRRTDRVVQILLGQKLG